MISFLTPTDSQTEVTELVSEMSANAVTMKSVILKQRHTQQSTIWYCCFMYPATHHVALEQSKDPMKLW